MSPERENQSESGEDGPFFEAYRFRTLLVAGSAYRQAESAIKGSAHNLSVFRFELDRVPHVATIGAQPPVSFLEQLHEILKEGSRTTLPPQIIQALWERRLKAAQEGDWIEHHWRPGKRLT